jgi:hypothetical protein
VINVKVGISIDDGIGSFGSWNMEMTITFRSKFVHISSIILATKALTFIRYAD